MYNMYISEVKLNGAVFRLYSTHMLIYPDICNSVECLCRGTIRQCLSVDSRGHVDFYMHCKCTVRLWLSAYRRGYVRIFEYMYCNGTARSLLSKRYLSLLYSKCTAKRLLFRIFISTLKAQYIRGALLGGNLYALYSYGYIGWLSGGYLCVL